MAVTDIITLILSIAFLMRGASRGFMNSLTGPFSIIVGTILSIIYYQTTKNIIVSLLIGIIGPIVLNLLLKLLIKTWAAATNSNIKPDFLSSLGGAILTLIWGWVFIIFTLLLLAVIPNWGASLKAVHNDVVKSWSYKLISPLEKSLLGDTKSNVPAIVKAVSNNDVKSLAQDPRFQKILQDPDIQKEINAHDITGLMRNPKMMDLVQQIMDDPATMKKVMGVYSSQLQTQSNKNQ